MGTRFSTDDDGVQMVQGTDCRFAQPQPGLEEARHRRDARDVMLPDKVEHGHDILLRRVVGGDDEFASRQQGSQDLGNMIDEEEGDAVETDIMKGKGLMVLAPYQAIEDVAMGQPDRFLFSGAA